MRSMRRVANKPRTTTEGIWLTGKREQFNLCQSDVATFLCVKLRKPVSQGRIVEWEVGRRPIPPEIMQVLRAFFEEVETLRRRNRSWAEAIPV